MGYLLVDKKLVQESIISWQKKKPDIYIEGLSVSEI